MDDPDPVERKKLELAAKVLGSGAWKRDFEKRTHEAHYTLVARGLPPNDAAALAIQVVAGTAHIPESAATVLELLGQSKGSIKSGAVLSKLKEIFFSVESVCAFFAKAPPTEQHAEKLIVDYELVQRVYDAIVQLRDWNASQALLDASCQIAKGSEGRHWAPEAVSILLENPLLDEPEHQWLLASIEMCVVVYWTPEQKAQLVDLFAAYPAEKMQALVGRLQQHITVRMFQASAMEPTVEHATKLLELVHTANERSKAIPFTAFYNDAVNHEDSPLDEDYLRWRNPNRFSFCRHAFVYDPSTKASLLQLENHGEQFEEFQSAMYQHLLRGGSGPYLVLRVRRGSYLVNDTLMQIQNASSRKALKKPLKVAFVGEQGVDEGGVQKEFFQLLMRDLFSPHYGMFTYSEDTGLYWFRASKMDLHMEFELVGTMLGLALYNSHILEFAFPMLIFRKLVKQQPQFADLAEVHPDIHKSLAKLLAMDTKQVAQLGLYFQVEQEGDFGEGVEVVDLCEGGGGVPVKQDNKHEYVQAYTRHLLDTSISEQFSAFERGFSKLCNGPAFKLFRPEELEQLVCGGRELDFLALQRHTLYDDGYFPNCQVMQWFWEVVHALSEEKKRRLLFFVTGTDRVPIKGLASLTPQFIISRNGAHSDRLPTAHTCFNHLLLPQYNNKAALQSRLETAIDNAEGFGLM